jgi:membrane protein implicated in regulation of membrane protease activity
MSTKATLAKRVTRRLAFRRDAATATINNELADQRMIGKVGRVTGTIRPKGLGEVMVVVRGGSEAFHAYSSDPEDTLSVGTRVVVIEYYPPRTVVVSPV